MIGPFFIFIVPKLLVLKGIQKEITESQNSESTNY